MSDLNPERFTRRQAAQARDDFAQVMDELDFVKAPLARLPTRRTSGARGITSRNSTHTTPERNSTPSSTGSANGPASRTTGVAPRSTSPLSFLKQTIPRARSPGHTSANCARRLKCIAERLNSAAPDELAGQLAVLVNGAFVSTQIFEPGEAASLLRRAADALIAANAVAR